MSVVFATSGAFALSISVSSSNPAMVSYGDFGPSVVLKSNESFTVTLSASDVQGTVEWNMVNSSDMTQNDLQNIQQRTPGQSQPQLNAHLSTVQFTSSGNTATITGTMHQDSYYCVVTISAVDRDENGTMIDTRNGIAMYNLYIFNSDHSYGTGTGTPQSNTNTQTETPTELNVGIIAPVELSDDIIQKLANNISVDRGEIKLLTSRDFSSAEPPEPTQAMKDQVQKDNYEFVAKLNTITVSEDGYYVFAVTVSDDLVGTKVSDLRLFYAESSDFTGSSLKASFGLMGVLNGVTGGFEVSNFLGVKLDTVPKQFLATMFLSASKSITVYILKILLFLAGCNAGFGILGLSVGGFLIWKFFRRHS